MRWHHIESDRSLPDHLSINLSIRAHIFRNNLY
jgi:hypothetical protein